jgi:hypothetical protein
MSDDEFIEEEVEEEEEDEDDDGSELLENEKRDIGTDDSTAFWRALEIYGMCKGDLGQVRTYWQRVDQQINVLERLAEEGAIMNKRKAYEDEKNMKKKRKYMAKKYRTIIRRRIAYLPDELLLLVFSYLDVIDLLSVAQVNHHIAQRHRTSLIALRFARDGTYSVKIRASGRNWTSRSTAWITIQLLQKY